MLSRALLFHFSSAKPLILVDGIFQFIILTTQLILAIQLSHSQTHLPIINHIYFTHLLSVESQIVLQLLKIVRLRGIFLIHV
jgi:hypothetical protein